MPCFGTRFLYEHPSRLPHRREMRLDVAVHQLVISKPCQENEPVRLKHELPRRYEWLSMRSQTRLVSWRTLALSLLMPLDPVWGDWRRFCVCAGSSGSGVLSRGSCVSLRGFFSRGK